MTQNEREALDAISEEAEKLLQTQLPDDALARVETIIALARYRFDVRSDREAEQSKREALLQGLPRKSSGLYWIPAVWLLLPCQAAVCISG